MVLPRARKPLALAFALIVARVVWWWRHRRNRITYNALSPVIKPIVDKVHRVLKTYSGPIWLPSGVLQTASTEMLPAPALPFRREPIRLPELERYRPQNACCPEVVPEGLVSIDWLDVEDPSAPVAIIVPGLTGDSDSGYVRRVAHHLWTRPEGAFRVACYNPRGRGGNELVSPFLYSAGYTEDLRRIVAHVKAKHPSCHVVAAGFSLGSNYLAKFVGEEGDDCHLTAAACLACPVDCLTTSNMLDDTLVGRHVMSPILVGSVQRLWEESKHLLSKDTRYKHERLKDVRSMHDFDGIVTAPMMGFPSASSYYRWSSSGLYLDRIRRPTIFVHALNDPIINSSAVKLDDFERSHYIVSCMTREGGHSMDWSLGKGLKPWSAKVAGEFFSASIAHADFAKQPTN